MNRLRHLHGIDPILIKSKRILKQKRRVKPRQKIDLQLKKEVIKLTFEVDIRGQANKIRRQNEVAKMLGITTTSVCRIVKELDRDGKLSEDKRIGNTRNRVLSQVHEQICISKGVL